MLRALFATMTLAFTVQSTALHAQEDFCAAVDGAIILNSDNEFIGTIENQYSSDSIYNSYSQYGNEYNSSSIWNEYGKNGNEFMMNSAFNEYSVNPPRIIKNRKVIAYLTVNKSLAGGVHPTELGAICYGFKPSR